MSNFGNTGIGGGCETKFGAQSGMFLMAIYADDGTRNELDLTVVWNESFFTSLTQNPDPSKRLYPIHQTKDVQSVRPESLKQSYADGSTYKLQDALRPFTSIVPDKDAVLLSPLLNWGCRSFGIFRYDVEGLFQGIVDNAETPTVMRPMQVSSGTWDVLWNWATDTSVNELPINFQFDRKVRDQLIKHVTPADMDNFDVSGLGGLFDVNAVYTSPLATGFDMQLTINSSNAKDTTSVQNLVLSDFTFTEVSPTPSDITSNVATVTESATVPGFYTVVFTLPETAADVIHVDIDITKNYDTENTGNVTLA